MCFDKISWRENENLAHHVWVLLVAAHEPDHWPTGRILDDGLETLTHQILKGDSLLDDRSPPPAFEQRLLNAREAAAQHADHQIVLVIGLCAHWPAAVELLQERHEPLGDTRQDVAVVLGLGLKRVHTQRC